MSMKISVCAALALSVLTVSCQLSSNVKNSQKENPAVPEPEIQAQKKFEYLPGGPLEGVKLPPYPTYHGEPAGKPGDSFGFQSQVSPGSVENWRHEYWRYVPAKPLFDVQSMVYVFNAPQIPGADGEKGTYAQPVWHYTKYIGPGNVPTGKSEPPVGIMKIMPGHDVINTTVSLKRGMYCIRIVGAVDAPESKDMFLRNLSAVLTVEDSKTKESEVYRKRMNYTDQFYSMGEFLLHVTDDKTCRIRLSIEKDSIVPLLVRSVVIDDALTGSTLRNIKKHSSAEDRVSDAEAKDFFAYLNSKPEEQLVKLEDSAWNSLLTLNAQYTSQWWAAGDTSSKDFFYGVPAELLNDAPGFSITDMNYVKKEDFEKKYGVWTRTPDGWENKKMKLTYSLSDYNAGKALPDPYPIKDNGLGVVATRQDGKKVVFFAPLAETIQPDSCNVINFLNDLYLPSLDGLKKKPEMDQLYTQLIRFVRLAYNYPAFDEGTNDIARQVSTYQPWGRGVLSRRCTIASYLTWYTEYANYVLLYDRLFPLIQGNERLAKAVSRHIPWVKTPDDVIKIFDVYFVQNIAKRKMRYHYYTDPGVMLLVSRVLNYDPEVTPPFIKWSFTKDFRYPMLGGINWIIANNLDRAGFTPTSSSFYGTGQSGIIFGRELLEYSMQTGETEYQFNNPKKHPKIAKSINWYFEMIYAGQQFPRIGDVTGPEKPAGSFMINSRGGYLDGWKYLKNSDSAAMLYHVFKITNDPELNAAALKYERMPYLTQPSRMIPNWAGILETGKRHDDFRFRRGVSVTAGVHRGHNHEDSLDLQISSNGMQVTADAGQRPGYSKPSGSADYIHNTVTGKSISRNGAGRIESITDSEHYASLVAGDATGNRTVALVDVDDDGPIVSLPVEKQVPGVKLPPAPKTPNAYVFDVFREKTPGLLRYNFHAANDESENFAWNVENERSENKSFGNFPYDYTFYSGDIPGDLTVLWKIRRTAEKAVGGKTVSGPYERTQMRENFNEQDPERFVRLHLLGLPGKSVAQRAQYEDHYMGHRMTMISAAVESPKGRAFVGVIEPFCGEGFIKKASILDFSPKAGAWDDPVGAMVETNDGQTHWNISSLPGKTVTAGDIRFDGRTGFVSRDAKSLKMAALSGGTLLELPGIRITAGMAAYKGEVAEANYPELEMTLKEEWNLARLTFPVVMHVTNKYGLNTSFTVVSAKNIKGKTVLSLKDAADVYVSEIESVKENSVTGKQQMFSSYNPAGCTVTNASMNKFWKLKADRSLEGTEKIAQESFAPENLIRYWEYGPGDQVSIDTNVMVERQPDGTYRTVSNTENTVEIKK